MDALVQVDGVGKRFARSLRQSIIYGLRDIARDMVGAAANTEALRPGEFWALQEVSFALHRGECVALIGGNGAGKSSLLKMINGLYPPDRGHITVRGRVAALLEVGAGFHPHLSGRENIYVNGAILGMTRAEITANFESIVDYAGIREALDTPVSHYSSGMYVRLGFAICAHLRADVLLIDEVLAVGDVSFRSRCYDTLSEQSKRCGIVLVSHNLPAVARLATHAIVLQGGKVTYAGAPMEAIHAYSRAVIGPRGQIHANGLELRDFRVNGKDDSEPVEVRSGGCLDVEVSVNSMHNYPTNLLVVEILSIAGEVVAEWNSQLAGESLALSEGGHRLQVHLEPLMLTAGLYFVSVLITSANRYEHLIWLDRRAKLEVHDIAVVASCSTCLAGTFTRSALP